MYKLMLIAGSMVFAAGCGTTGPLNDECAGANGPDIHIRYGDSKIVVTNKVKVKSDGRLVIRLHPDNKSKSDNNVDYKSLEIELAGKDAASKWINTKLDANDRNSSRAVICVNNKPVGTYSYLVKIPGVGVIDPRVQVIPD